jgi:hypothetical protein
VYRLPWRVAEAVRPAHLPGNVVARSLVEGQVGDGWHIDSSFKRHGAWWGQFPLDRRALLTLFLSSDL